MIMQFYSIYRMHIPDDFEERQRIKEAAEQRYAYIKAKIEAEKLNPNYDKGNRLKLLNEVALSICDYYQRNDLVVLLGLDDDDFDEE